MIAGEPTENHVAVNARGVAQFEVSVIGVPSHAGAPYRGVNPISLILSFLDEVTKSPLPTHVDLGPATMTPISVTSSGNPPMTPERCAAVLDYRPLPGADHDEIRKSFARSQGRFPVAAIEPQ